MSEQQPAQPPHPFGDVVRPGQAFLAVAQLVVPDGTKQFQWGMAGQIPLLSLVGGIVRIQQELFLRSPNPCRAPALVLAWEPEGPETAGRLEWFLNSQIDLDALCGYLETVKLTILGTYQARQAAAQQVQMKVLGPDGRPADWYKK